MKFNKMKLQLFYDSKFRMEVEKKTDKGRNKYTRSQIDNKQTKGKTDN